MYTDKFKFYSNCKMQFVLKMVILCSVTFRVIIPANIRERLIDAKTAIKYVNDVVKNGTCTGGTDNKLILQFDHTRWDNYARIAVKNANLLSKLIQEKNGTLEGVDESYLYALVRNNIQGDSLVFGSAIAFEEFVYPKQRIFCPYAFMEGLRATVFDLAQGYDYLDPDVEWYAAMRKKDFANVTIIEDKVHFGSLNETPHFYLEAMSTIGDGGWTYPYYDCGGGDIWMVTYSCPILGVNVSSNTTQLVFRGVATIDIELTNIDVNQCDLREAMGDTSSSNSLDVFRGTHSCQPTTMCVALSGNGFRRGSYVCVCETGYYFPITGSRKKSFNGSEIENYYDAHNVTGDVAKYQCLKCARGCDSCVDDTPCMIMFNMIARVCLLLLSVLIMLGIITTSFFTHRFKSEKVIKSASPIFLQITLLGSALMNCQMVLLFSEPSDIVCMLLPWFAYMGFTLAYGALLLKTWRISTIFRYGKTKRVNLPDKVLLQWFLPVVAVAAIFLTTWTALNPPMVEIVVTDSLLKYVHCRNDWWLYAAKSGEVVLLLWGVYLSFTVRKAPSQFNESKYISWSIYNAVLLGTFMVVIIQFLAIPQGPDMVYAMLFLYLQIRVTMTLCLFFAPKFYSLYKLAKHPELAETEETTGRGMYRTTVATISNVKIRQTASSQTLYSWINSDAPIKIGSDNITTKLTTINTAEPKTVVFPVDQNTSGLLRRNQVAPSPTPVGT